MLHSIIKNDIKLFTKCKEDHKQSKNKLKNPKYLTIIKMLIILIIKKIKITLTLKLKIKNITKNGNGIFEKLLILK